MKYLIHVLVLIAGLLGSAAAARADDAFAASLDTKSLQTLIVQHDQSLKTLDSFARQALVAITGSRSLDGQSPVYTVLDMAFRPDRYKDREIIHVRNAVLRKDMADNLPNLTDVQRATIGKTGMISLTFWLEPRVQQWMATEQQTATFKAQAINQLQDAAAALQALSLPDMGQFRWFAPAVGGDGDQIWHTMGELYTNVPQMADFLKAHGSTNLPPPLPGYDDRVKYIRDGMISLLLLREDWVAGDVGKANDCILALTQTLPQVNASVYPSMAKRKAEVIYNRLFQLTIPAIMCYFSAFILFLLAARSGVPSLRLWGLRVMLVALLVHTVGIGVRWWLVQKSLGSWFEAIPIKNMFESVMFSAWFGATIGLILELRFPRSLFGAAASFVGLLAMVALLTVPFFTRDVSGEIGQVNGVLISYWLYIHVTMVTASYALICMGFLLSVWWLIKYYSNYGAVHNVPPHQLSGESKWVDPVFDSGGAVLQRRSFILSILPIFYFPATIRAGALDLQRMATAKRAAPAADASINKLATLDACNLVVLQLAFWVLGVGIILGAVWADMSWGRPWGWDPKETFALVTWITYLVVVHMRVATNDKAWWTAVLSVAGFFIMLFNWIGVNFFLVGLHSYA